MGVRISRIFEEPVVMREKVRRPLGHIHIMLGTLVILGVAGCGDGDEGAS